MAEPADLAVDPDIPPSGTGCVECLENGGWWLHLRRCAACGHVGCCDTSPAQHATGHFETTGHPVVQSFEPDEEWFWDYRRGVVRPGPELAPPTSRPAAQDPPAPRDQVPADWEELLN